MREDEEQAGKRVIYQGAHLAQDGYDDPYHQDKIQQCRAAPGVRTTVMQRGETGDVRARPYGCEDKESNGMK